MLHKNCNALCKLLWRRLLSYDCQSTLRRRGTREGATKGRQLRSVGVAGRRPANYINMQSLNFQSFILHFTCYFFGNISLFGFFSCHLCMRILCKFRLRLTLCIHLKYIFSYLFTHTQTRIYRNMFLFLVV